MNEMLTELAPSLQRLVDARLDNIDRALLSTDTSRYERRQIVSAVEDQIQELIARIDRDEPTREDILRLLASLDPPEAFGSGSMQPTGEREKGVEGSRFAGTRTVTRAKPRINILAVIAVSLAGLSLMALGSSLFLGFIGFFLSLTFALAASTCGVVSLCQVLTSSGKQVGRGISILGVIALPTSLLLIFLTYFLLEGM